MRRKQNNLLKTIDEGFLEIQNRKVERKKKMGKEGAKLYSYIIKKTSGWASKWIDRLYTSIDSENFTPEKVRSEMNRCRVYDFMRFPIQQALESYQGGQTQ